MSAGDGGAYAVAAPLSETIRDILRPRRIEVQILNTHPIITGWAEEPKGTLVAEVVAFLATRRGCATREQLRAALYPAGISDSTLRSLLTRVRIALGSDVLSNRNPLRLSEQVGCDWARFQDLFTLARNTTGADKRELLTAALSLVEGQPFSATARETFSWAEDPYNHLAQHMRTMIINAATACAGAAAEDGEQVIYAARKGLLGGNDNAELLRILARALLEAQRPDEARIVLARLRSLDCETQ